MEDVFSGVALAFESLGALAMVIGLLIAIVLGIRAIGRGDPGEEIFGIVRRTLGGAILLGLEVLVAADLVRTITSKPSIEDALILGIIVLIRTVLSISIQIEIDGVLPWRRAMITSGATVVAHEVRRDANAAKTAKAADK